MKYQNTKSIANNKAVVGREIFPMVAPEMSRVSLLENSDRQEVLEFLKIRPVHTFVMTSFIKDNGLKNADNRGKFYNYRNPAGRLEGVALVGHTTLVEARSENSLTAFALIARQSETPIHFMMSDGVMIETFWKHYTGDNRAPRLICSELLFELNFPVLPKPVLKTPTRAKLYLFN